MGEGGAGKTRAVCFSFGPGRGGAREGKGEKGSPFRGGGEGTALLGKKIPKRPLQTSGGPGRKKETKGASLVPVLLRGGGKRGGGGQVASFLLSRGTSGIRWMREKREEKRYVMIISYLIFARTGRKKDTCEEGGGGMNGNKWFSPFLAA